MDAIDDIVNAVSEVLLVFEEAQSDYNTDVVVESRNLENLARSVDAMIEHNTKVAAQIKDDHLRAKMETVNSNAKKKYEMNFRNIYCCNRMSMKNFWKSRKISDL